MEAFIDMRLFLILVIKGFAAIVTGQCNYTQICSNCGVSEPEANVTWCQQYLNYTEESHQYLNYTEEQCLDFSIASENASVMVYSANFSCIEFYCNRSLVYHNGSKATRQLCNASCLDIEFIQLPGMKVNVTDAMETNTTFYNVTTSSPEQCMAHCQSQSENCIMSYSVNTRECLVFKNSYILEMEDDINYNTYEWNCKTSSFAAIVTGQCNYTQTCSNCGVSEPEANITWCQQYLNYTEESHQYLNYTKEQCLDFSIASENASVMVYSADSNCIEFYCNISLVYHNGSKATRQVCNASCLDIEFIKLPGMKVNVTDAIETNTTFYNVTTSSPEQCMAHCQSQSENCIMSYSVNTGECLVFKNSYLLEMEDDIDYHTYEWHCKTSKSTTTTSRSAAPKLYIMPCLCNPNKQWTNLTNEQIIEMLITELTIDKKETTMAHAKLNCRPDSRASSKAIGNIAVTILSVILGLVICSDIHTLWMNCRGLRKRVKRVYLPPNKVGVSHDGSTIQSNLSL